jgi:hypothetical protein
VLLSLFNFVFSHPSTLPHSAGELPAPPPLGFPLTRWYRTSPPRPKASSAPHHPPEEIPPLHHRPPSPWPAERRPPSPLVRARGPPCRRSSLSDPFPTKLSWGKVSLHSPGAHARFVSPCSPAHRRNHEHPDMAAATPHRRPCSVADLDAHHPPVDTVGHVGPVELDHLRPNPRRRREHRGQRCQTPSRAGKGIFVISFSVLGA